MPIAGPPLEQPTPINELLDTGLRDDPDGVTLVSIEKRRTWRDLAAARDRLAAGLSNLGLRKGDRVASLMPNRCDLIVHYLACMRAGLVAVPLNYRYQPPEIDHALAVSGASALLAHTEREPELGRCERVGRLPLGVIRYESHEGSGVTFEDLAEGHSQAKEFPAPDPNDPAFLFFTSGSTGPAKGVTHTFGSLGWMFAGTARAFEMTSADVVLPGSSISHLGGFMFSFAALSAGARVVVARGFTGDDVLPLLRRERPTVLCMLPAALFGVVRDGHAERADFASLRLCRSGGDKVPLELEREFTELTGFPIDEGYGCSEIGLAALNPPSGTIKLGSVGRPIPGYTMSLRDDSGAEVPADAEGRLWVKTHTVMAGYWGDPAASAEVLKDGWLDTGDLMRADADGYLWFRGRKKQIIVHDGSNICPQEVEGALLEHPAVAEAGVIGVHDLLHGENVRAYVTFREGAARPTGQELIRFARDRVGYKAPEEVVALEEMPLNPTGKVDRVALMRLAVAGVGIE